MQLTKPNHRALNRARYHNALEFILDFQSSTWPSPPTTTPKPHEFLSTEDWALAIMVMTAMALLISILWSINSFSAYRNKHNVKYHSTTDSPMSCNRLSNC